ncbi:MAG: endolytic transglycosylase MltG [Actinomycetota bacterium]
MPHDPQTLLGNLPGPDPQEESRRSRRRRRWGLVALIVAFLVVAGGVAGAATYYSWCKGSGDRHEPITITIPDGATGEQVVQVLSEEEVIRCGGFIGRILLNGNDKAEDVRAGEHELRTEISLDQAIRILSKPLPPATPTTTVTIPEGYTVEQIVEVLSDELGLSENKLLTAATDGSRSLPPSLPEGTETTEGFLFPNTYEFFTKGTNPGEAIDVLLQQFDSQVAKLPWENAKELGVTPYEIVTIASMVEREASVTDERPLVSAVIYNRLEVGEILGIDATLQYIDPNPEDGLTQSDLEIDSPYNTRLFKGLPPTPIANPGLDSIRAALEPADSNVRYYVLCGEDGSHEFTDDYDEFLADKQRCLG